MASQVLPVRAARLGRRTGVPAQDGTVRAAVLVLPAGPELSIRHRSPLAAAALRPLARRLVRAGHSRGLVGHLVHYRFRGWNGDWAHPVEDAEWAVDEVVRRYGDIPVCLVGMGMGARAALRAAGRPAVESVVALAPWVPAVPEPEPVQQLAGRRVLIVHGTNDSVFDPEESYRYARRLKKTNRDVCRFEVHSDGHHLVQHRHEVFALAEDFVVGTLLGRGLSRPVADALAAPPPLGLRMPLASGFGRSLRH
ncbi:prolyl oligopeptidase family serine peptidase [Streptomyces sp. HB2AG]|uniref:prolyl oligopeptidase family serine peptidase n=1 Tax=Streptomyces sp. HB2AG TaxID=2983400 RepID=UPI0022AB2B62|nr:prolyl oligopeptidase family serine peptidase [Streptomyces sp. HB2AG]MCZ2527251.1 prolyl oligopeptidase family serine peptidase [Streptomyces sp. HB2AG]